MASFIIEGGHKLQGDITPQGAKNEALEVICATLLTSEEVRISNVPEILDVLHLIELLRNLGVEVTRIDKGDFVFKAANINPDYASSEEFMQQCATLRGSVMLDCWPALALLCWPSPAVTKSDGAALILTSMVCSSWGPT